MMKQPESLNQTQLARHLGLSQATVSRALRGDRHIAEATRRRVAEEARKRGYHFAPLLAARASKAHSSGVLVRNCPVALVTACESDDPDKLRRDTLEPFVSSAADLGLRVKYFNVVHERREAPAFCDILFKQGIPAVIFTRLRTRLEWLESFDFERFVLVSTDAWSENRRMTTILPQSRRLITAAYAKARERGCRRIGAALFTLPTPDPVLRSLTTGFFGEQFHHGNQFERRLLHFVRLDQPKRERMARFRDWVRETRPELVLAPTADFLYELDGLDPSERPAVILLFRHEAAKPPFHPAGFRSTQSEVARLATEAVENGVRMKRFGLLDRSVLTTVAPEWIEGTTPLSKHP